MADIHTTEHEFGVGVTYAAPIDLNAKKPLDARFYADTIAERDAHFTNHRCYPGMQVYVGATGLTYIYNGEREVVGGNNTPIWLVLADQDWVAREIADITGGNVTETRVREIIAEVLASKSESGELDDIREYTYGPRSVYTTVYDVGMEGDSAYLYYDESSDKTYVWRDVSGTEQYVEASASDYTHYFPEEGISGIQYIDKHQNLEYRWDSTENEYVQANEIASSSDIEGLFE